MPLPSPSRALVALCLSACAATAGAAVVDVTIDKVGAGAGTLVVSLCVETEFLKRCALRQTGRAEAGQPARFRFEDVPPGRYAVSTYHDANDNGKLDRNFMGIPEEGVGFSRDAKGDMGPPDFADAAFDVRQEPVEIALSLDY
jgi:uncharacterized protein (DUF2141 family)